MNYLADTLERLLNAKKMSQVELANRSGISQSQISKWLRAEQTSLDVNQMSALAKALSDDENDHAELIKSHLMDENFGPGSNLIRIVIDSNKSLNDKPRSRSRGEHAITYLCEIRLKDRTVNDLLIDLARCLGAEI